MESVTHPSLLHRVSELAGRDPLLLSECAWPGVADLRLGGLLVIPVGATEQHGPHLPISCDTLLAEAACWFASARTGVPIAPAIPYAVSAGHTAKWPGTFSLLHDTFIAMTRQLAAWVAVTGWSRLLFVNSHFGNDAPLRVAVDQIRLEHLGNLQVATRNIFDLTPDIRSDYFADAADLHANKAETDLLLHLAPGLVKTDVEADDPDRTAETVFSYPVAQTSLNGVTGFPSRARAADGQVLFEKIGAALTAVFERAKTENPPLSPEHWAGVPRLSPAFFQ